MKKILYLILSTTLIWTTFSCSNELVLVDDWKNIPVVYGLLSRADTAIYIRVEKAFIDPEVSALEIAQLPDSLYYDNVSVQLERASTGDIFTLDRVDGNAEGYPREDGAFANTPNYLYKISATELILEENETINFRIVDANTDNVITEASTQIVGDYGSRVNSPPSNPIRWENANVNVRWSATDFPEGSPADEVAYFYDVRFVIYYQEIDANNTSLIEEKEVVWLVEKGLERGNATTTVDTDILGEDFFRFMSQNIDENPNVIRRFLFMDIVIDAGAQDLFEYINIGQANTGITSAQTIPTYTNLSNGFGIFSSRNNFVFPAYGISSESQDSLRDGRFTSNLNFQ